MIRRTVSRAFGPQEGGKPVPGPVPQEGGRGAALKRLFHDLFDALEAAVQNLEVAAEESPPRQGEPAPDSRGEVKLPRLTKPRALAEGIEFFLQGRGGRLRFLYPLRGFIQVSREPRGEVSGEASVEAQPPVPVVSRPQELLLVQLQGESYRPIEKPFPPGLGQALFSRRPTPFRYTSVPELARKYLREVSEVSA